MIFLLLLNNPRPLRSIDRVNGRPAHLGHSEDEVHGRMLRVDAFQLHPLFKAVLHCWHSLGLDAQDERELFQHRTETKIKSVEIKIIHVRKLVQGKEQR